MSPLRIAHVVGARPNFMKIAPVLRALDAVPDVQNALVHTGQHYDDEMSAAFFRDLGIREPDVDLEVGSGTHGAQTAAVLERFERYLLDRPTDLVVVVGDVNSTAAAALAAAKLHVGVAHVEAGLRSGDRTMPEELNRLITDQLSDLCLTPSRDADENLRREGIPEERIRFVGNVMIDSLFHARDRGRGIREPARRPEGDASADVPGPAGAAARFGLDGGPYGVVTLHRPSNVDDRGTLADIVEALEEIASELPLLLPVHPRTRERLDAFGIELTRVRATDPVGYLDMVALVDGAALVLTDSGGLQEETTALGVPCLTLRDTTERPVTISEGTNTLVPDRSTEAILAAYRAVRADPPEGRRPELWDGRAAERIRDAVLAWWAQRTARG